MALGRAQPSFLLRFAAMSYGPPDAKSNEQDGADANVRTLSDPTTGAMTAAIIGVDGRGAIPNGTLFLTDFCEEWIESPGSSL